MHLTDHVLGSGLEPPDVRVQASQPQKMTSLAGNAKSKQSPLCQHARVRPYLGHAGQPSGGLTMNKQKAGDYIGPLWLRHTSKVATLDMLIFMAFKHKQSVPF